MSTPVTDHSKKEAVQKIILDAIAGKKRCGAGVSMGIGKTLIGLKDMGRILAGAAHPIAPRPIFLVVASTAIISGWKAEMVKFSLEHLLPYVDFTTYASLARQKGRYHKIYLDECQRLKDSHKPVLDAHAGAILGLTGTEPKYKNSEKGKLVKKYCPIIIDYTTDEAVNAGILNDYRIVVHGLRLSGEKKSYRVVTGSGKSWWTSEQENYAYWSQRIFACMDPDSDQYAPAEEALNRIQRMQALMKFPTKERYLTDLAAQFTGKVILFVNNKDQADRLASHAYYSGHKPNKQNLLDFNAGTIDRLACVQMLSEGVNIQDLRTGLMMHAFGNEVKASQRIGRMLRLNPDQTATVHILMYLDTVDVDWVESALEKFDAAKIFYVEHQF